MHTAGLAAPLLEQGGGQSMGDVGGDSQQPTAPQNPSKCQEGGQKEPLSHDFVEQAAGLTSWAMELNETLFFCDVCEAFV